MNECGPVRAVARTLWERLDVQGERTTAEIFSFHQQPSLQIELRPLEGSVLAGTLLPGHAHLWFSPEGIRESILRFRFDRLGGEARASLTVCKVDRNLQATPLWRLALAGGRRSRRSLFTTLAGVEGCLLAVHIVSRSHKHPFSYRLEVQRGEGGLR